MGRSPCSDENGLKKGPWSPEEDRKLIQYIQKHGHGSWRALPKNSGLNRCGKSCRLRWTNYLRPDIKRGKFSADEEQTILSLHSILGNKWSAIATHLPGRTDNEIKNFWNTHLKKKLIQMGFDPMTHRPRNELYNNLPHLMAIASLGEIMAYQHHQLQQLQNLQKPESEDHAIDGLQSEAVALIRYHQYLQFLLQEAAADQTTSNSSKNADMEAMHLLALPSSTRPNVIDEDTVIWDTDYFDFTNCPPLSVDPFKSLSDELSVSSLSNLQIPSSSQVLKNPAMNSENNQDTGFLGLLHQEEGIQLKSPLTTPIVAAGSHNHVENNNNLGCAASSFWPELFFEEPFIDVFE